MESIVKDSLMAHLEENSLMIPSQHGFMPGKSWATNLLEFLEVVTRVVDEGKNMDIVFLDFAKAFDKVPKERLLVKLTAQGVGGRVKHWVRQWLTERKQRVVLRHQIWQQWSLGFHREVSWGRFYLTSLSMTSTCWQC